MTKSSLVTIGILQPGYLPWLGFFEQLYRSDVFVLYDDVQYDKNGWRNRNRIKTPQGPQWLTVPVLVKSADSHLLRDIKINNTVDWRKKHLLSVRNNYSKTPYFQDYICFFEEVYARPWESLVDLDVYFISGLMAHLGLRDKKLIRSSELNVTGDRFERLVGICKKFGAGIFYEGAAGRDYIDTGYFKERGIQVVFQDYQHPVYPQLYGDFVSHLSVIDLLFNCGKDSLSILVSGRRAQERGEPS